MEGIALLLIVGILFAIDQADRRSKQANVAGKEEDLRFQLKSLKWARNQKDLDAAAEILSDELQTEDNREMEEWAQFKAHWRPGLINAIFIRSRNLTNYSIAPTELARRDFFKAFRSRKPEIHAKISAVNDELKIQRSILESRLEGDE